MGKYLVALTRFLGKKAAALSGNVRTWSSSAFFTTTSEPLPQHKTRSGCDMGFTLALRVAIIPKKFM